MAETITRCGGRISQIVGFDVTPDEAEQLVEKGQAARGPDLEAPAAVYLQQPIRIRGFVYPTGALLHVGGEISEAEALGLVRGTVGLPARFAGAVQPDGPIV